MLRMTDSLYRQEREKLIPKAEQLTAIDLLREGFSIKKKDVYCRVFSGHMVRLAEEAGLTSEGCYKLFQDNAIKYAESDKEKMK